MDTAGHECLAAAAMVLVVFGVDMKMWIVDIPNGLRRLGGFNALRMGE